MRRIALSRRAEKDLRRIGPGEELNRIRQALDALAGEQAGLDVKPLRGQSPPWLRLRVRDYRILYRRIDAGEPSDATHLVARVVHRSELERAVSTLA